MTEPHNLIVFLTDNHARSMLGAAGHPTIQTPNLDRIANNGVRFTNAYCVSPLCCPSRAALATGRYPHDTGYWDNALAYDGAVPTWQQRVRDSGHYVASVGKLHYRSGEVDNGFSEEIIPLHIVDGKGALQGLLRATPEGVPPRVGHKKIYEESGIGEADYQIYDQQITDNAVDWLEKHGNAHDAPWVQSGRKVLTQSWAEFECRLSELVDDQEGYVINVDGDGWFVARFSNALKSTHCAVVLQREMNEAGEGCCQLNKSRSQFGV